MQKSKRIFPRYLRITEILYVIMVAFSFYLLLASRTGEARTIWEVLNPYFIPTLLATTFLLLTILFTSEKVSYKLMFVIAHSILIHSFLSIIFPAGDLSAQRMTLGRIRLVYDNAVLHGYTPWNMSLLSQVYEWFRGITFQAGLSVVLARMLSIDLLWVHLFLVPVLWGVFVPIASFLIVKIISGEENVAVFSSLLISAFPYATYFGAISVSNSLGFVFFFYSLYFMLKGFGSNDSKNKILMLVFSFFSLLSHNLTGIMSLSLLILALAFRSYKSGKNSSPTAAKASLLIAFIFCVSLLPLSFVYLRYFQPATYPLSDTVFTLNKFSDRPIEEIVGLFFLGELTYAFDLKTTLLIIIGLTIALLWMILYILHFVKRNSDMEFQTRIFFLFTALSIVLLDYRIMKLFMEGLPINEERLWVFQDFLAVPFVALAIYDVCSSIKGFLNARLAPTASIVDLKSLSRRSSLSLLCVILTLNIVIPMFLAGWITVSLNAAYPHLAPLQTTWYELEAVKYIEENTYEKYVVVGDHWTTFAGEVIVGVNNPRAYYFLEFNRTVYDLFQKMLEDPTPQAMIEAMNVNNARVAYFVVTEPRLGTEEFNRVVAETLQDQQLKVFGVFGGGRLYVFKYEKT